MSFQIDDDEEEVGKSESVGWPFEWRADEFDSRSVAEAPVRCRL